MELTAPVLARALQRRAHQGFRVTDAAPIVSADGRLALEQVRTRPRARGPRRGPCGARPRSRLPRAGRTADTADGLGAALAHAESEADSPFLVVLLETGEVVGDCGWKGGPGPDGRAEIGYGLAASVRGRGLGTEMVRTLTGWALSQPGCTSVVAEVLADNLPSRRALERAGFALDRVDGGDVWYVYPPA